MILDPADLSVLEHVVFLCDISRSLRRDRELAFYGAEDLTPSDFFMKKLMPVRH
jgi:hypothetical protein